ncbi:MAG: ABC transporter permease, partial [Isosphaeraceae bacterium]
MDTGQSSPPSGELSAEVANDPAGQRPLSEKLADVGARYGILVVWGLVIALFGALRPETFLTTANFQTIFGSQAVLLILAIGLIISLTAGEFDLSFAGVMSVSLVLVGWLNVEHH